MGSPGLLGCSWPGVRAESIRGALSGAKNECLSRSLAMGFLPVYALPSLCPALSLLSFFFFLIFKHLFTVEKQRDTEHEQGRGRERGRHRIRSRLQALSCQHRARRGARTHKPRDHDLSRSQSPNHGTTQAPCPPLLLAAPVLNFFLKTSSGYLALLITLDALECP